MESALVILLKWAEENCLSVNPPKIELILFTRKYKIPDFNLTHQDGITLNL